MIGNQKRETQKYININNTRDKKKWVDYFTSLYAGTTEPPRSIPDETEIVEAIQKLKNGKSPGVDSITNEMIKYGGPKLWHETAVLIKQIFKSSNKPVD
jgi:hypothetical protein